jgi:drug/metabolite transporter (DMT)-like permease
MASGLWSVAEAKQDKAGAVGSETLGYAVGITGWILTAGVFIAAKVVIDELPPWTLCFFRVAIAFLVLLPVVGGDWPAIRDFLRQRWLAVLIVGGLGLGITQGIMYQALAFTTAVNVGIIFATAPIITMIMARFVLGERMTAGQGAGSVVALAGVVTIAAQGSFKVITGLGFGLGDILVVIAATCFSAYTVLLKREKFDLPRLPLLVTLLGGAAVVTFPLFLYEVAIGAHDNLTMRGVWALAYAAIPGGALMYLLYNWSIELLGASRGGSLMYLQMIFTTFLAWLILGEAIEIYHFVGMALILAGVALVVAMKPAAVPPTPSR